ncbi:recombinase family protein [Roseibium litorale]|uniref:Recombinase family protein n=1 Tax=Roseibium litorale TaxID=2803841 RepID=A0ABR9CV14_9HYPH|nr:recombinase family protein [Roseibium litorale]MBD8894339.1 recombinase family protein [Roseibium litorale]
MQKFKEAAQEPKKAVIYCRVSGKKQTKDGSGLSSQEYRCRQYADAKGYSVEEVFPDDVSGGGDFMKRKGMVALLRYLDDHPNEQFVVIFDDLKRYARDVEFHLKLRRLMHERGAIRECLNFNFEDTPEGKLNETVTAAAGAYERESMARQNRQKSIARLEQGFWVFRAPVGYKYVKSRQGGKELVPDEPLASVVRNALEGFASGLFASQTEVQRYLENDPYFPKDMPGGRLRPQTVPRLLRKPIYAGYVYSEEWGISVREGNHEGLISKRTHQRIIDKLDRGVYAPARKDINDDFPLRGAVSCSCCNTLLTAGWSRGCRQPYAYYRCRNRSCDLYGKGIRREVMEADFQKLLAAIQPSRELTAMASAMFHHCWDQFEAQAKEMKVAIQKKMVGLEKEIERIVDRAVDASNPRVISAYENKIEMLEKEKLVMAEKLKNSGKARYSRGDLFELSMRFLTNPRKIWDSGRSDLQKIVLRLVFLGPFKYSKERGFLNYETTLPFKALGGLMCSEYPVMKNGAAGEI